MMLAAATKPAPKFASVRPEIPPEVARIVDAALEFQAAQRWPSARMMRASVLAAIDHVKPGAFEPVPATVRMPTAPMPRSKR
jgi:hypothetical protein